jgi:hypothetical protein
MTGSLAGCLHSQADSTTAGVQRRRLERVVRESWDTTVLHYDSSDWAAVGRNGGSDPREMATQLYKFL